MWKFPLYKIGEPIKWEAIEKEFDWFRDMCEVPQDPIWHAEGNVQIHTKMVVKELMNLPEYQNLDEQAKHILFTAALFHDVEKRSTTTTEEIDGLERIVSPNHAKKGEFTARRILYQDIGTPFEIREQIANLVRLHGLPLWILAKEDPTKEAILASLKVNTFYLYLLAKADMLGRICHDIEEQVLKVELFKELCQEHHCFGNNRTFETHYARYFYLNREEVSPDYVPFDDLKFEVIMMCALPGSGKDTYIERHLDLPVLSLDDIRREQKIDPTDKKGNGRVIQLGKEKAKEFMRARTSFVYNATNITSSMRSKWISLFTSYGGRVKIIYVEVPYQRLIQQNHNRIHKVPGKVLENMIKKLEIPTVKEAHEVIYYIENKEL